VYGLYLFREGGPTGCTFGLGFFRGQPKKDPERRLVAQNADQEKGVLGKPGKGGGEQRGKCTGAGQSREIERKSFW